MAARAGLILALDAARLVLPRKEFKRILKEALADDEEKGDEIGEEVVILKGDNE